MLVTWQQSSVLCSCAVQVTLSTCVLCNSHADVLPALQQPWQCHSDSPEPRVSWQKSLNLAVSTILPHKMKVMF